MPLLLLRATQLLVIVTHGVVYWLALRLHQHVFTFPRRTSPFGATLAATAERCGPTFVKLAQVLASRPDIVGVSLSQELRRLCTAVRPVDSRLMINVVRRSFLQPIGSVFDSFDPVPLATGSIAQVYRAVLRDGRAVAVKVKRPDIEQQVELDFRLLRVLARLVELSPALRTVALTDLVTEFELAIRGQLDFAREAASAVAFQKLSAEDPTLRFPAIIPHLCSAGVVTMEYLSDLYALDSPTLTAVERRHAAATALRMLYRMIFVDHLVHCDLHAGNVFYKRPGTLAVLDCGFTASLTLAAGRKFREFFLAMACKDGRSCARIILETAGRVASPATSEAFTVELAAMIDRFGGLRVHDFDVLRFSVQLFAIQRRHSIRGSMEFTMTIWSLVALEGLLKHLDPDLDFQREAMLFVISSASGPSLSSRDRAAVFRDLRSHDRQSQTGPVIQAAQGDPPLYSAD